MKMTRQVNIFAIEKVIVQTIDLLKFYDSSQFHLDQYHIGILESVNLQGRMYETQSFGWLMANTLLL